MGKDQISRVGNLVDLAARDMGGEVVLVSDDFFASKENIINEGRGDWDPIQFDEKGKVYDGWESRRNRSESNDWIIIKLATRGQIELINIDTNHFIGNAPQFASLEVVDTVDIDLDNPHDMAWESILSTSALKPDKQNLFVIENKTSATYVRLQIYPDGGIARIRLHGNPLLDDINETKDYASQLNGGRAILASDMFFGEMSNLLKPTAPKNMGDGWETKRRRGDGHDWVIIQLGKAIVPMEFIVDTMFFKGNYPEYCSIEVCDAGDLPTHKISNSANWIELVSKHKLDANKEHSLTDFIRDDPITHVRMNIYPDGGVARFKVRGSP